MSCICPDGYAKTPLSHLQFNFRCDQCINQYPNSDMTRCMYCTKANSTNATSSFVLNGHCVCPAKMIAVDTSNDMKTDLTTIGCKFCPGNQFVP